MAITKYFDDLYPKLVVNFYLPFNVFRSLVELGLKTNFQLELRPKYNCQRGGQYLWLCGLPLLRATQLGEINDTTMSCAQHISTHAISSLRLVELEHSPLLVEERLYFIPALEKS